MELVKVGKKSVVIKYTGSMGRQLTLLKYYPQKEGIEFIFSNQSTNINLLIPCVGKFVDAILDDYNGDVLGLVCKNGPPVVVLPDNSFFKD